MDEVLACAAAFPSDHDAALGIKELHRCFLVLAERYHHGLDAVLDRKLSTPIGLQVTLHHE